MVRGQRGDKMMKKLLILILPCIIFAKDGATLYVENSCNSCHGMYGEGSGTTPRLEGQKEVVLFKRLKDLKAGKTRTPSGGIMISFAKALSDEDIVIMAKYLSTIKPNKDIERYELEYDSSGDGGS
ncbi:cytochrome c, class I [hydrothermal vent metagenome]|uniref:Cytochrome c, class I n=1 Tax=hydrothermal vent metagenome TaxID=652676 RepID=A0A1W1C4I7_9ZZZZ